MVNNNFGQYLAQVQAEKNNCQTQEWVNDCLVNQGIFRDSPVVEDDEIDWQDYLPVPTPEELMEVYGRGFRGIVGAKADPNLFGAMQSFYELFPWAKDIGKGRLCLPYLAVLAFEPTYGVWEAQTRGSCFPAGTLVTMADGKRKPIEDIQIGDAVLSANKQRRKVISTLAKRYSGKLVEIGIQDHGRIVATPDHKFVAKRFFNEAASFGWRQIDDLDCGSVVLSEHGTREIGYRENGGMRDGTVYCIGVETDHSFIANGYAVHNCVSHGTRNAGMGDYCADVLMGETQYKGRFCTENIYRMRGYNSCGANCGDLCVAVGPEGKGGFIVRGKYGDVDLTTFSSSTEAWAARGSSAMPEAITTEAIKNKSLTPFRCKSPEEERDAHACGFGTNGCSGLGFSSTTDEFGFAAQRGSWSHSMARMGTNDTPWSHNKYGSMTVCTVQSWGKWNTQKGVPEGVKRMPGGAFWVSGKLFGRYSIYGFADVVGFGRKASEYADYIRERAKKTLEYAEQCYDAPETLPSQA